MMNKIMAVNPCRFGKKHRFAQRIKSYDSVGLKFTVATLEGHEYHEGGGVVWVDTHEDLAKKAHRSIRIWEDELSEDSL